ncbi:MAG: SAM-dependent chlorinase/fluorinase, partial [Bdellovibrionales bacterium]|nr:SAM-dependent chlorinase/fluorinase [Bdellovibrionales bacterium]
MRGLVHVIADYSPGDLAFAEMVSALMKELPDTYHVWGTSVASFDTIALGFEVAQLGLQDKSLRPEKTIIYANCAPRRDRSNARKNNEGEGIVFARLNSGVPALVVNSGYSLSFVRTDIEELYTVNVDRGGSQFRSRDVFPPLVGKVARDEFDFLGTRLEPLDAIPDAPHGVIGYVDSFGNIKTTYRQGDPVVASLKAGERIAISIHGVTRPAIVATENFNVEEG